MSDGRHEPLDADAFQQAIEKTGQHGATMSELTPPNNAPRRYFELGRAYERALAAGQFFDPAPILDLGPNDNLHCGPPPKP